MKKTEVLIGILIIILIALTTSSYGLNCSENETLIQAVDQNNNLITELPANTSIYFKYRKGNWPNQETLLIELNESNNFSTCVNNISDQIKTRTCGKDKCSDYKYIEKDLSNDLNNLNNKVEFIITTVNLNDQYGPINNAHEFYNNAFMNVYNSNNKLIFGCGNCQSTENSLKNSNQFIVPKESNYNYKSLVKTSVTTYNDIVGNIITLEKVNQETITSTFRNINITFYDQNKIISINDSKYPDLFIDIIKESNNKILWDNLKTGNNYLIPSNIIYKTQEITDPSGDYNDIKGPYNILNSSSQTELNSIFRKILIATFDENCNESSENGYIIRPSNSRTIYQVQNNEYFYAPIESEIKYKLENGDLLGPVTITNNATKLNICSIECSCSGLEYEEPCIENWTCTDWSSCTNSTQTRICTDQNSCGTEINKPSESQNCTENPGGGGSSSGGGNAAPSSIYQSEQTIPSTPQVSETNPSSNININEQKNKQSQIEQSQEVITSNIVKEPIIFNKNFKHIITGIIMMILAIYIFRKQVK